VSEAINDPNYWKNRLAKAVRLHHSVYRCTDDQWKAAEQRHMIELEKVVKPNSSILDVGCGYGRLLDLLPSDWQGDYLGIDISPDFLELARMSYPDREFREMSMEGCENHIERKYDYGVLVSIRPMIIRYNGQEVWDRWEQSLLKVANELVFLEIM
jgi:SAM-dependent methyltransferase